MRVARHRKARDTMKPIKTGDVHTVALVGIQFDLDQRKLPRVELGDTGTPTFTFSALVRLTNGRDAEIEFKYGPDNIPEAQSALKVWERITLAWHGKLGHE